MHSEGRGREFESRRARHEIKDLDEAKTPSVPVVSNSKRRAEGRSVHARSSTTAFALCGAMPPACTCSRAAAATTDRIPRVASAVAALRLVSATVDGQGVV